MTDAAFRREGVNPNSLRHTDFGAVWAGVFVFTAIWCVFGSLGLAIFASTGNALGVGMSIWSVILTIIAMYVAGRETGQLAAITDRHTGLIHGMVMFGLSFVAAVVLGGIAGGIGVAAAPHTAFALSAFTGLGWAGFCALFFGLIAAMSGASTGATQKAAVQEVREIRPAA